MMIQGKVWGYTCPLFFKNNVELHFVKIKKGGYCSKHLHKHKFNQFIVFDGSLKVTVWKDYGDGFPLQDVTVIGKDQACVVPPGEFHKFEALEDTTALEVYWIELSQNDIVRQDHGGLSGEKATGVSHEGGGNSGSRQAVFIDDTPHPLAGNGKPDIYGKKYFGND